MIVDFIDLSSDDEEVVIDLTSEEHIFDGEHAAHGQGDASQDTTLPKQEFIADDGQAATVQCTATVYRQEVRADDAQGDAAQCAPTFQRQEFRARECATTSQSQELRADNAKGDAAQCAATLQRQELKADDARGDAAQCAATSQMQELRADDAQGDAAQCATASQREGFIEDDGQGDAAQPTTLQRQELTADDGQGDAAQPTAKLQTQELTADDGQGDAAQPTTTLQRHGLIADDGQGDATEQTTTLQSQELTASDGQGDAAHHTTLQRQELIADDAQCDSAQCATTLQRQKLKEGDGQDAASKCRTTLQRQESIADDGQSDVAQCTTALQRQEPITACGEGDAAQGTATLQNQKFLAAGDSMEEAMQSGNSAEATTSLSRTQQTRHGATASLNTPDASTAGVFPRQFWKAGEYRLAAQDVINNSQNHLRIHPKFLHSNATSHKWPFSAIAELLDNAIDEVASGATFVKVDKMKHSPDGNYSLVIEDNGGGMNPESLRRCLSFGFSQKRMTSSIGQYGNGLKTSTMRLGADAIVFSCTQDDRRLTRSIGLLSYTFLMRTKCNDIYVPVVDYECDSSSSTFKRIMKNREKQFSSNLSTILWWSPFSTEDQLLNQFSDMECHGTKIIIFNLWFNDAWQLELDFMMNKEDIMISGAPEIQAGRNTVERLTQMHVAKCFRYSLRVDVITTIGFLKGAPRLDIYGFNVYHKNRLILPFWPAGSWNRQRRGIAGVLEANFIRPTHDKQDFEKTGLFQRLETRLKDMATEYWIHHCHMIGYTHIAKSLPPPHYVSTAAEKDDNQAAQATNPCPSGYDTRYPLHNSALTDQMDCDASWSSTSIDVGTTSYAPQQCQTELHKRGNSCSVIYWTAQKRQNTNVFVDHPRSAYVTEMTENEIRTALHQNMKLKAECSELEAERQQLKSKEDKLRKEIDEWRRKYKDLTEAAQFYDALEVLQRGRYHNNSSLGFI